MVYSVLGASKTATSNWACNPRHYPSKWPYRSYPDYKSGYTKSQESPGMMMIPQSLTIVTLNLQR